MIYQIVSSDNDQTIREFIKHWAPSLARHWQVIQLEQLAGRSDLPVGTYLFTDLDRLNSEQLNLLSSLRDQLAAAGVRTLNNPSRAMQRYELLKTLYEDGVNSFRAFKAHEAPADMRFPVFVRNMNDHKGALTHLIECWDDWEEVMVRVVLGGANPDLLLTTEFCDTRLADGEYAMYTAFRIGDRIVPRHIYYSKDWMVKWADVSPVWRMKEKWDYIHQNPDAQELMDIFQRAKVEYGRIDYGLLDGRIQVWEININPAYSAGPVTDYPEDRREMHQHVANLLADAFLAIETPDSRERVPISLSFRPRAFA